MKAFELLDPRMTQEHVGFIPFFLDEDDPRPAREQLDAHYQHGGGWSPFKGFTLNPDNSLQYPGDPPTRPLAQTTLHNEELIVFYDYSWVAIIQPDRSFEVCRMD